MSLWWLSYPLLGVFAGFVAGLFGARTRTELASRLVLTVLMLVPTRFCADCDVQVVRSPGIGAGAGGGAMVTQPIRAKGRARPATRVLDNMTVTFVVEAQ